MKDTDTKEKFVELRGSGLSYDKIGTKLKTSKQTLIAWSQEFEVEISNLKQIRLDALREQYLLTKEHQIELLGGNLATIREELAKRDLEDIPTEKLFYLLLKYLQVLKTDNTGPIFSEEASAFLEEFSLTTIKRWQG